MSSSPRTKSIVNVPSAPITITFMLHRFFSSRARSRFSSLFTFFFSFTLLSAGTAMSTIRPVPLFLLTITRSSRLVEINWFICISKSQRMLYISFSRTYSWLCIYDLFIWSNLNFLHNSQSITLPPHRVSPLPNRLWHYHQEISIPVAE